MIDAAPRGFRAFLRRLGVDAVLITALLVAVVWAVLDQPVQVLVSNAVAVLTLFWVGWFWARWTDYPRWIAGPAIAGVGLAMVTLTVVFDVA